MNLFKITMAVAILFAISLVGCADASQDAVREKAREAIPVSTAPPAAAGQTASVNSNVSHYICKNNCIGSGGDAQADCPVCGEAYQHNQAYHNNPTTAGAPTTITDAGAAMGNTPTAPSVPEPAQNADGVWHYTCAKGCAGGAGSPIACGNCGSELAHNQAYH